MKPKALLIAEKKSVADDIKKVYTKIQDSYPYEVDFAYCAGHLLGLCTPDEYEDRDWKEWNKESLPLVPDPWKKKVLPSKRDFIKTLKQLYRDGNYDIVINAGDAGREGQLIQTWVYEEIGVSCPVYRYWADNTTAKTIEKTLNNLIPNEEFQGLTYAAILRAYLDWMCGMNYSRAGSIALDRHISVGRVMSPTLAMIVHREQEIKNFSSETYYELEATFSHSGEEFSGKLLNPEPIEKYPYRFNEKETLEAIGTLSSGVISSVEQEEKTQYAPMLYNLTDLQKECSSKYGMSPKKTLDIAESLYLKHLLSYPRTESKCLSSSQSEDIPEILSVLSSIPEFATVVSSITAHDITRVSGMKKYFDDAKVSDHPALTPTGETPDFDALDEMEKRVYKLVAKRVLSIFLPPKKTLVTTLLTDCNSNIFRSTGTIILDKGFTTLYDSDSKETILPNVKKGDTVSLTKQEILTKETKPPKRYTPSTILTAMETAGKTLDDEELEKVLKECSGLGTSATRADILDKLISDEYVNNLQNTLYPTPAGVELIEALEGQQIISVELTANWEKILKCVERNQLPFDVVYTKIIESVTQNTNQLLSLEPLGALERKVIAQCPKCQGDVYESKKIYFCQNVLLDENPCDFRLNRSLGGVTIPAAEFKKMCEGEASKVFHFEWKDKKKTSSRLQIRNGTYEYVKESAGQCPKCGRAVIVGNKSFYCEGKTKALEGICDFSMYNKIGKTTVPKEIAAEVFAKGISQKELAVTFPTGRKNKGKVVINQEKPQFFALQVEKKPVIPVCACVCCEDGTIMHDGHFYKCSNYSDEGTVCNFKIWDAVFESSVNSEQLQKMLNKETVLLPFLSKDKKYSYKKKVSITFNQEKSRYEYLAEKTK